MSTSVVNTRYTSTLTSLINNGIYKEDETVMLENLQTSGNIQSDGSVAVTGDMTVAGNLTVDGTQTVVNSQELLVNDPIISVSYSTTGTPTADGGIEVVRGTSTNASLIWNESLDKWVCGLKGAEQVITTADNTQTLTNKSIDAGQLTGTVNAARIADASLALSKLSDSTVTTSSNTQTLTNKSIDAAQLTGTLNVARIADASIALAKMADSTITTSSNSQTLTNKTWSGNTIAIASGGTNNTSAYTSGSVIYSNGTSLTQDNANLYYASGTLGIGTNTPSSKLHLSLISSGAASDGVLSDTNTPPLSIIMGDTRNHSSGGSGLEFDRGCHWIYNADSTNRYTGAGAVLKNLAGISMAYHNFGSYPSDGNQGNTNIKFYTTNNQSASVSEFTEKMRILYNGNVGIGITAPTAKLHVNNTTSANSLLIEDDTTPDATPFVISNAGLVGIGRTVPNAMLNIHAREVSTDFLKCTSTAPTNSGTEDSSFYVRLDASGHALMSMGNATSNGSTSQVQLHSSGTSYLTGGSVGIGISSPDASAILDITSGTKGMLPPRASSDPSTPATGLVYYNTSDNKIKVYNGSTWKALDEPTPPTAISLGQVYYDANAAANSSTIDCVDTTANYRIPFLSVFPQTGNVGWGIATGAYVGIQYTGTTSTKLAQHTISLSGSLDEVSLSGRFKVFKNPTWGVNGNVATGTVITTSFQSTTFPATANLNTNVCVTFTDVPSNNDSYYLTIQVPGSTTATFKGYSYSWCATGYL